jgi:hypothetical protein
MLATLTSFRSSRPRPRPKIKMPPVAVVDEIMGPVMTASRNPAPSVSEPCTTRTVPAESRTPQHGGEGQHRDKVEGALEGEETVVSVQAVLERTDHRQRPNAEQEARCHESPADRTLALREPPLQIIT